LRRQGIVLPGVHASLGVSDRMKDSCGEALLMWWAYVRPFAPAGFSVAGCQYVCAVLIKGPGYRSGKKVFRV
jgi:hypothetical protein